MPKPKPKTPAKRVPKTKKNSKVPIRWPSDLPPLSRECRTSETTIICPPQGRKEDQETIANRKALLLNPEFREDIIAYQTRYPDSYWKNISSLTQHELNYGRDVFNAVHKIRQQHEKKFGPSMSYMRMSLAEPRSRCDARDLCQKWDLHHAWRWIEWLAMNWDPQNTDLPSLEPPPDTEPIFALWYLEIEEAPQPKKWEPRKVTLTLKPGVSYRSAQRGLKQAMEYLEKNTKRSRPGLADDEKNALWELFSRCSFPEKRKRQEIIRSARAMMEKWGWNLSEPTVAREYRR